MWYYDANNEAAVDDTPGPWAPTWQTAPVAYLGVESNENILANKDGLNAGANITFTSDAVSISQLILAPPGDMYTSNPTSAIMALLRTVKSHQDNEKPVQAEPEEILYKGDPFSKVYFPVHNTFDSNRTTVAIMLAWIRWAYYFQDILPSTLRGVVVVLDDSCGGTFSYSVDGSEVTPLGKGDLHDSAYDSLALKASFGGIDSVADGTEHGLSFNHDFCPISIVVYPSASFEGIFRSNTPFVMTFLVVVVFCFTGLMFLGKMIVSCLAPIE